MELLKKSCIFDGDYIMGDLSDKIKVNIKEDRGREL